MKGHPKLSTNAENLKTVLENCPQISDQELTTDFNALCEIISVHYQFRTEIYGFQLRYME